MMISREKNVQIIVSLLKDYGIKDVIISPGNTNTSFVGSIQHDPYFNLYSCVDERSAAYMACGIAQSLRVPVVISCTGATASRNYYPGLTEAYYRKLPILALTSSQQYSRIGHLVPQTLDRSNIPYDVVVQSFQLPVVKDKEDFFDCEIKVNRAFNILTRDDAGPVHLDLPTTFETPFDVINLPKVRKINVLKKVPEELRPSGRIAIFLGSRSVASSAEQAAIDEFCKSFNAVVLCDHTSGYSGPNKVDGAILFGQENLNKSKFQPEILIHAGQVSGDYYSMSLQPKEVWRVDPSGEIQDTFRKLTRVFQLSLKDFLNSFHRENKHQDPLHIAAYKQKIFDLRAKIPSLPFSNIWVASKLSSRLPKNITIHFGILNSLRSWNFFEFEGDIESYCNVGGFGIDGAMSSFIGTSIAKPEKRHFLVLGDLAFFYDMNVLGNRHLGTNLNIIIINNGEGTEFKTYGHHATYFGDKTSEFISARGHNGQQSKHLLREYVERLGFKYFQASTKNEFMQKVDEFLNITGQNTIFEIFTSSEDEAKALKLMRNIESDHTQELKSSIKKLVRNTSLGSKMKRMRQKKI